MNELVIHTQTDADAKIPAWLPRYYESGTTNVEPRDINAPWLYLVTVNPANEDNAQQDRYRLCGELAEWLNGNANRPVWLNDMERLSETRLTHIDGLRIDAVGPMYDANPPHMLWQRREDDDAKNARARLIDYLTLVDGRTHGKGGVEK